MMATIESLNLEHLPSSHTLHLALFKDVKNAAFLHQQLLSGNTDFEYAFIDASIIISRVHVLAAAYRAVNDLLENRLKSRNVHSEIVFCLSPNSNIAESFRRFGITPTTTNLLVIKLSTTPSMSASEIQTHLATSITGTQIPFTDENLAGITDISRVKKIYKLNSLGGGKGGAGKGVNGAVVREIDERRELEVMVLGSMALRGVN